MCNRRRIESPAPVVGNCGGGGACATITGTVVVVVEVVVEVPGTVVLVVDVVVVDVPGTVVLGGADVSGDVDAPRLFYDLMDKRPIPCTHDGVVP